MLSTYQKKRNFQTTPEPSGDSGGRKGAHRFVVQRHDASHLHFDFRVELGGVLKSWAVPKGPSMNPSERRLAVQVEDHPVSYINFSGTIPKGNYGAGTVEIWDEGTYVPIDENGKEITEKQALLRLNNGQLKFILKGKKLAGEFALIRLKNNEKNWLLIKHRDAFAENGIHHPRKKTATNGVIQKKSKLEADSPKPSGRIATDRKFEKYYLPMLASPVSSPFDDKEWVFEIKWDGYRAIADWNRKELKFYSRNGLNFGGKYPLIAEALTTLEHSMVLDGEIVALNEEEKPDFQLLQQYEDHPQTPIIYYVFDILFLDGKDLRQLPLLERKKIVKKTLPKRKNGVIGYCDHIKNKGNAFFKKAAAMGLEGIMAKKADSRYYCGVRNKEWLKIKNLSVREAIIVGFTKPRGSRKHFGALVLADRRGKKLVYLGHTGTGFTDKTLKDLWTNMQPYIITKPPFRENIKVNAPVTWLRPVLVCQVKFTEQTKEGLLRHPVFLGLREDKKGTDVQESNEVPIDKNQSITNQKEAVMTVNGHPLKLTNLSKVFWPKEKITKGDLIAYYEKIASIILPYLKDRPLSLKRNPNGIMDKGFFQKDAGESFPDWIKTTKVYSESTHKTVNYTLCNDKATLLYLANLGCIEMNPWNSTISNPDNPTYLILDIDPSEKNSFDQVVETAKVIGEILDKAGAIGYCKTSGATGIHVYIPLQAKYSYVEAREFAKIIATLAHEQLPSFTSLERSLAKRGSKIYIDYLQNSKGQTIASAYSARPVPGAQVSAPLLWKELTKGLHPSAFTIHNMEKRIKSLGDVFYMVLKKGINIPACLKKLGS